MSLPKKSLNYRSAATGHAHPLFYDTLFVGLRDAFGVAAASARDEKRGLWEKDRSHNGVRVTRPADPEQHGVVFPKLFRRPTDFLTEGAPDISGFQAWVSAKREQVLDLTSNNFTHFDNVLEVQATRSA